MAEAVLALRAIWTAVQAPGLVVVGLVVLVIPGPAGNRAMHGINPGNGLGVVEKRV